MNVSGKTKLLVRFFSADLHREENPPVNRTCLREFLRPRIDRHYFLFFTPAGKVQILCGIEAHVNIEIENFDRRDH